MKKQIGDNLCSLLVVFVLMVVMCLGVPTVFADEGENIAEDEIVIDVEENADVDVDIEDEDTDVDVEESDIYAGASEWAVEEIKKAAEYNLLSEKVIGNYTSNITREEFCELAVRLYEELSGQAAELPEVSPFVDTENPEILKANLLGIVLGITETEFAPNDLVTREQIATMFYRTIKVADPDLVDGQYEVTFEDKEEISEYALEAVGFMSNKGILGGVGNNEVAPKGNATREQGIALVKRAFETFKDVSEGNI